VGFGSYGANWANDRLGSIEVTSVDSPPKVSILIPTYNQASVVSAAVRSAQSQTYNNIEIIVGDDASTDEAISALNGLIDHRTRIVRNERNLGRVGNYKNLLVNHATGDYVVNLDGDDYYTDTRFVEKAVNLFIQDPEVVIVAARATVKSATGERIPPIIDSPFVAGIDLLRKLPDADCHLMHMACIYQRRKAIDLDFYRADTISSDWESLYRLAAHGRVAFLQDIVGVWQLHGANESQSASYLKHAANLGIWRSIYEEAIRCGFSPLAAAIRESRCVATFALMSLMQLSKSEHSESLQLLRVLWLEYRPALMFIVLSPSGFARLGLVAARALRRKAFN
jgi:glycosyltransferase involved in cell wall biosynthesis